MPAVLQLVVDNAKLNGIQTRISHTKAPKFKLVLPANQTPAKNQLGIAEAQHLLEKASYLLNGMGARYSTVTSIIDECKEMISREGCEPFANLGDANLATLDSEVDNLP